MSEITNYGRGHLLIALLLALAVYCPEPLNAQVARAPAKDVVRQIGNRRIIMNNGRPVMLPEWLSVEVADGESGWRVSVSDATFDQLIFGFEANAEVARQNLDAVLQQELEDLHERNGLTAGQWQKLYLAGNGDLKRLFDRLEDSRGEVQSHFIRTADELMRLWQDFSRESEYLRSKIRKGPFGKGSLLAKTLKGSLTADQIAAYERWKQDRPAVVTRSWDLRVR